NGKITQQKLFERWLVNCPGTAIFSGPDRLHPRGFDCRLNRLLANRIKIDARSTARIGLGTERYQNKAERGVRKHGCSKRNGTTVQRNGKRRKRLASRNRWRRLRSNPP